MDEVAEFLRMEQVREVDLPGGRHKVDAGTFKVSEAGPNGERLYVFEEAGVVQDGLLDHLLAVRDAEGVELAPF